MKFPVTPEPARDRVERAAEVISEARNPIILAGNGVVRARAWKHLADFAAQLDIPVANTFMAKGVLPFGKNPLALGSAGLQANDYISCGFSRADVIICVGYDLVEYHPHLWHPTRDRKIIHIDTLPAEVDASYNIDVGVVGDIKHSLMRIQELATPHQGQPMRALREALIVVIAPFVAYDADVRPVASDVAAAVGDALGRVLEASGAELTRDDYFNDHCGQIDRFAPTAATPTYDAQIDGLAFGTCGLAPDSAGGPGRCPTTPPPRGRPPPRTGRRPAA